MSTRYRGPDATDEADQRKFLARPGQLRRPVVIELGAGVAIPTVRHFSQRAMASHGATLVRINLREPAVQRAGDVGLRMGALAALAAIDAALQAS